MEKWKIVVIVLLIGALGGYGFYQQNASSTPQAGDQAAVPTPSPANDKLLKLQGQTPPAWNFSIENWVNTPKPIALSDLKGHVTIVEFFRIGCIHCQEAAPHMEKLFREYSSRGVKLIAIQSAGVADEPGNPNPENDWDEVKDKIKEWKLTYPVAYDEGGALFKQTYNGETYPTILILDKSGVVRYANTGYTAKKEQELRAGLEKVLSSK